MPDPRDRMQENLFDEQFEVRTSSPGSDQEGGEVTVRLLARDSGADSPEEADPNQQAIPDQGDQETTVKLLTRQSDADKDAEAKADASSKSGALALLEDVKHNVFDEAMAQIVAREQVIAKHLNQLRAEILQTDEEDEQPEDTESWLDASGKEKEELKEESLAKFDGLEDDGSFDSSRFKKTAKRILIALTATAIVAFGLIYLFFFNAGMTRVPDLIGLTSVQATAALRDKGLSVGEIIEEENPNVMLGVVLNQDPKVDRLVARGSTVTIVVSAESNLVVVPSVSDMSVEKAQETLNKARLIMEEVPTHDALILEGGIVGQLPVGETLIPAGSTVTVLVSRGESGIPIPTPRVMGLSDEDAHRVLENAGFFPLPYYAATTFGRTGEVVAQTPATGMLAYPGSPVQFLVSENLAGADSHAPDVVGMREENAKLIIEEAGFFVTTHPYVDSQAATGTVLAQMPLAQDVLIRKGDTIDLLVVRSNEVRTKVPDLLGETVAAARGILREHGFNPIVVPLPDDMKESTVFQQFPARDSDYFLGLPVLLYAGEKAH